MAKSPKVFSSFCFGVGQVLRVGVTFYEVTGVHLGAVGEENSVELEVLTLSSANVPGSGRFLVPERMLHALCIAKAGFLYSPTEVKPWSPA